MNLEDQSRPGRGGSETDAVVQTIVPTAACDAYVVLVITPADKYVRRVFLSLHSATSAVQRAWAAGKPARMVLCRLQPVTAELPTMLPGDQTPHGAGEAL